MGNAADGARAHQALILLKPGLDNGEFVTKDTKTALRPVSLLKVNHHGPRMVCPDAILVTVARALVITNVVRLEYGPNM
jgi:hypothetical protein